MATTDSHSFGSFAEFYPYYLSEHTRTAPAGAFTLPARRWRWYA